MHRDERGNERRFTKTRDVSAPSSSYMTPSLTVAARSPALMGDVYFLEEATKELGYEDEHLSRAYATVTDEVGQSVLHMPQGLTVLTCASI